MFDAPWHCEILTARDSGAIKLDMSEFFAMGGYAAFVWPAYGASAMVIAGLSFAIWRRGQILKKRLAARETTPPPQSDDSAV